MLIWSYYDVEPLINARSIEQRQTSKWLDVDDFLLIMLLGTLARLFIEFGQYNIVVRSAVSVCFIYKSLLTLNSFK